jgi:hypothetical protein
MDPSAVSDILEAPATSLLSSFDRINVRLGAAAIFIETLRTNVVPFDHATDLIRAIRDPSTKAEMLISCVGGIRCLPSEALPARLFADKPSVDITDDANAVAGAIETALTLLNKVWPSGSAFVLDVTELCIGLNGPRGQTHSFSNHNVPGLVAIAINNPPALVAEQLVHEAAHLHLALITEETGSISELFERLPACHSPFTRSVRTAERVFHGIVSYARVKRFWEILLAADTVPDHWFDDRQTRRLDMSNRLIEVSRRIVLAWEALTKCLDRDEVSALQSLFVSIVDEPPPGQLHFSSETKPALAFLSPISQAELLLAAAGQKVSRISLRTRDADCQEALLRSGVIHCYSSSAFVNDHDHRIAGFSNTFLSSNHVLDAGDRHESLCYVAGNGVDARLAMELDNENAAGHTFAIPQCCEKAFQARWPNAKEQRGDLFSLLLRSAAKKTKAFNIPWQSNFGAMYFGGGLCWHFPCRLDCEETALMIDERLLKLAELSTELAVSLSDTQRRPFVWSHLHGYGLLPKGGGLETFLSDVDWTFEGGEGTRLKTVAALISRDDWHLVTPSS